MEQQIIKETLSVTATRVTDEDKALGHEYNRILWRALARADLYLTHGPEQARLAVVKSFLSSAARLSAIDSTSVVEESRTDLLTTLSKMSEIDPPSPITPTFSDAPTSTALVRQPNNQD
jgi:hypothetical protein